MPASCRNTRFEIARHAMPGTSMASTTRGMGPRHDRRKIGVVVAIHAKAFAREVAYPTKSTFTFAKCSRQSPSSSLHATATPKRSGTRPWQDDFTGRLEALALLQTLNADLLGPRQRYADTRALVRCPAVGLASADTCRASLRHRPSATTRATQLLGMSATETIRSERSPELSRPRASEADHSYVPSPLSRR